LLRRHPEGWPLRRPRGRRRGCRRVLRGELRALEGDGEGRGRGGRPGGGHNDDGSGDRVMTEIQGSDIRKVVVACEAGMGSSVLLVTQLRDRLKGTDVVVEHAPV